MYCNIWYPKGKDFILISYLDVEWVGYADNKKSTNGGAFYLKDILVSCHSKKKESLSLFIIEA